MTEHRVGCTDTTRTETYTAQGTDGTRTRVTRCIGCGAAATAPLTSVPVVRDEAVVDAPDPVLANNRGAWPAFATHHRSWNR